MLYQSIINDMKESMKNHDKNTLGTIRMLKSAIDLEKINNKLNDINDDLVITVITRQLKSIESSLLEFEKGNRNDLIDNAKREIELLKKYLPEQLSDEELFKIIEEVFETINPNGMSDMGKIMKELTPKIKGKVDMNKVSSIIKEKLNQKLI